MLETALLFSVISSWLPTLGLLDAGAATTTLTAVFAGIWAAGGIAALVFHRPIERYTLAHHTQPA